MKAIVTQSNPQGSMFFIFLYIITTWIQQLNATAKRVNVGVFEKEENNFEALFRKSTHLLLDKNKQMAHLTLEQRYTIAQMKTNGFSNKVICQTIGKDIVETATFETEAVK
jgi:hypothetical protein